MSITAKEIFSEHRYGWVIAAVSTVCLALGFGAGSTVSVFMKPFEQEFGWLRADISMAYTMHTIGAGLGGLLWGGLSDRIGATRIAFIGAVAMSTGLAMLSWQNALWSVCLLYFLIGAAGFACLFTPLLALTGLWFNARKGLAIGIVTAGGAIGQGVVPYLTQLLTTDFGWRDAAFYLGAGYAVVLLPLLFLLRPAPSVQHSPGQADRPDANLWGVPHAITVPWLSLAGFFCCICMAVPLVHLVPLGIDLGCSPGTAAGMLLSLMVSGVFGRIFFGWLADRIGGLPAYFLASLAQTSVVFWFTQTRNVAALYQLSVLFGFGFAGVMTCLLICAREAAPARMSGLAMAIVSLAGWVGMGLGSYQAGFFYDVTASYLVSYGNAAIAGIVNLLVVAALIWYRRSATGMSRPTAAALFPRSKTRHAPADRPAG
ncbi:MAG: MFS transporter [Bradyrhizobium sp.]|uniref:MFS transporter n=1 Tax=Bradyrhizobium sp. TaxID=376 RepID=UPI0027287BFD|nr:MFS transporter [Bradyrhizobium sp.]MDO9565031.1 MFS transporter [Bradyrhizobium sp.]MDP3689976.1 MFS transporter [Bradyrhizobium sp.]